MTYDFDTPVERRSTDSIKWRKYAGTEVLPLWVADMDFRSPPAVMAALEERIAHGVFGYAEPTPELVDTVLSVLLKEFQWAVDPAWLVWLPGLVSGLSVCCRAVGEPGDGVAVMTPVYPPFLKVPGLMERRLETIPLGGDNEAGWHLDRRRLDAGLGERARLLLLCHPHNPVGRLWREEELRQIAEICLSRRMIICSDEIHNQLVLERGVKHVPMAALGPEIAARTITLLAPSKAYNLPGLGCSLAVIPDDGIRRRFERAKAGIVPHVNALGLVAARAAWHEGGPWLAALLDYLRSNRDYLAARVAAMPGITTSRVEATSLAWLDVRGLGLADAARHFENHGLGLSDGREFAGPGFMRLNFGCPRATLVEACDRLQAAATADQK